jgi:hypothetical protein
MVFQDIQSEIPPLSPLPESVNTLMGAPTAKFVSLGAQPFNDDDHGELHLFNVLLTIVFID